MDMLKEGISLRSYGQRNPIVEYKVEAFDIFEEMQQAMMETIILYLYHIQIRFTTDPEEGAHLEKPEAPAAENHLKGAEEHYVDDNGDAETEAAEEKK